MAEASIFYRNRPGIKKAVDAMLLAMGAINRTEDEEEHLDTAFRIITRELNWLDIMAFDAYILGLSEADFETLVEGEDSEREALDTPPAIERTLQRIFEEV